MATGIAFKTWNGALTHAAKHAGDKSAFVGEVITALESLCPELTISRLNRPQERGRAGHGSSHACKTDVQTVSKKTLGHDFGHCHLRWVNGRESGKILTQQDLRELGKRTVIRHGFEHFEFLDIAKLD